MKYFNLLFIMLFLGCASKKDLSSSSTIDYQKIWGQAPHSAFTDLLRFKGNFYCAFREGPDHVSGPNGASRVLRSADGKDWKSVAYYKLEGLDSRDPKLSVTPDGRIMMLIDVETYKDGKVDTRKPYVSYSDAKGDNFSAPVRSALDPKMEAKSDWVWRVSWHKGVGYAINYQGGKVFLLKTLDGKSFNLVSRINIDGSPNESTIDFDKNDQMYVVIRREEGDKMGVIAKSTAPYTDWKFTKMTERIGGPDFFFLDDQTLCIGSRQYIPNPPGSAKEYKKYITSLFITDLDGRIKKTIPLEQSGGDTSYPGLVVYKDKLWVSYYSSHAGKAEIYLAKVPLSMLK
jgi:hypothetical protein